MKFPRVRIQERDELPRYLSSGRLVFSMTLIVASKTAEAIWMVGDTAVTGGTLQLRQREYLLKILGAEHWPGVIGFAGGVEQGHNEIQRASRASHPGDAVNQLCGASSSGGNDFAIGFFEKGTPTLLRIQGGQAFSTSTLHLGQESAFATFQKLRHGQGNPYAPKALKTFMLAADAQEVPDELGDAIVTMHELFATLPGHEVGGWAVPYLVTASGTYFCTYGYSVSDPVFESLTPGSIVMHGTAEGGGATLSVSELPSRAGLVVYWLQLPGGAVLKRTDRGYDLHRFGGRPSEFKAQVRSTFNCEAHIWIGDRSPQPATNFRVVRGRDGKVDFTLADHGDAMSIAVHNMATPFVGSASTGNDEAKAGIVSVTKSSDSEATLSAGGVSINLDAAGLDSLVQAICSVRAELTPPVASDFSGASEVQIDPAWRTYQVLHPDLPGPALYLRH